MIRINQLYKLEPAAISLPVTIRSSKYIQVELSWNICSEVDIKSNIENNEDSNSRVIELQTHGLSYLERLLKCSTTFSISRIVSDMFNFMTNSKGFQVFSSFLKGTMKEGFVVELKYQPANNILRTVESFVIQKEHMMTILILSSEQFIEDFTLNEIAAIYRSLKETFFKLNMNVENLQVKFVYMSFMSKGFTYDLNVPRIFTVINTDQFTWNAIHSKVAFPGMAYISKQGADWSIIDQFPDKINRCHELRTYLISMNNVIEYSVISQKVNLPLIGIYDITRCPEIFEPQKHLYDEENIEAFYEGFYSQFATRIYKDNRSTKSLIMSFIVSQDMLKLTYDINRPFKFTHSFVFDNQNTDVNTGKLTIDSSFRICKLIL